MDLREVFRATLDIYNLNYDFTILIIANQRNIVLLKFAYQKMCLNKHVSHFVDLEDSFKELPMTTFMYVDWSGHGHYEY